MSRNEIPARRSGLLVVVGYDRPLSTFFAQVHREHDDDDPRDPLLLWIGTEPRELLHPMDLIGPLAPYAELTDGHLAQLRADFAADLDSAPTALQLGMRGLMTKCRRP